MVTQRLLRSLCRFHVIFFSFGCSNPGALDTAKKGPEAQSSSNGNAGNQKGSEVTSKSLDGLNGDTDKLVTNGNAKEQKMVDDSSNASPDNQVLIGGASNASSVMNGDAQKSDSAAASRPGANTAAIAKTTGKTNYQLSLKLKSKATKICLLLTKKITMLS